MGSPGPDNWDDVVARLPVIVGIDPSQAAVESRQENFDGGSVTWVSAVLQSLGERPRRSPTRLMGSP